MIVHIRRQNLNDVARSRIVEWRTGYKIHGLRVMLRIQGDGTRILRVHEGDGRKAMIAGMYTVHHEVTNPTDAEVTEIIKHRLGVDVDIIADIAQR